jgi:hypothetical protein
MVSKDMYVNRFVILERKKKENYKGPFCSSQDLNLGSNK